MAENDIMAKIPAIVVIIGAILAIVAFFLAWTSILGVSVSGLDFVSNKTLAGNGTTVVWKISNAVNTWQTWIPLICLIIAIIAAIAAVVTFFVEIPKMYLNIGLIVLGLVIVILAIVFFTTQTTLTYVTEATGTIKFGDKAGAGIWLALAGGVVIALVGALDLAGVFDKLTGGSNNAAQ